MQCNYIKGSNNWRRESIVAAGSLVINNIEPYSVYGGVPAKKNKK